MANELEIVNKIIEEHRSIRTHLKLVGETVSDPEGLLKLEQARPDWMLGPPEQLGEKRTGLEQVLHFLYDGLQNHFALEEKWLPPLLGSLIMEALVLEHEQLKVGMEAIRSRLVSADVQEMSHEQKLGFKWTMQHQIEEIRQNLEGHAGKEETVLGMVKSALEARERRSGSI